MAKNKAMKKGITKALSISHPNSRKAKALSKQVIKSTFRQKTKVESANKRNLFGEKLLWFRENIEPVEEYTAAMLDKLLQKYLSRFEEELEQINIKHSIGQRKNRQHANREDIINMTIKRDLEEYNGCGIEMVDILSSKKQLKMFQKWDGEMGFLNQFTIRRFSKSHLANNKPDQPNGTCTNVTDQSEGNDNNEMSMTESENQCESKISLPDCNESNNRSTNDVEMSGS